MEWIQTMSSKYVLILLRPVTLMNVRRPATQCYQINKSNEHTEANEAGKDAELWVIQDWTFFFFFGCLGVTRLRARAVAHDERSGSKWQHGLSKRGCVGSWAR
jgi:hypothetical protein